MLEHPSRVLWKRLVAPLCCEERQVQDDFRHEIRSVILWNSRCDMIGTLTTWDHFCRIKRRYCAFWGPGLNEILSNVGNQINAQHILKTWILPNFKPEVQILCQNQTRFSACMRMQKHSRLSDYLRCLYLFVATPWFSTWVSQKFIGYKIWLSDRNGDPQTIPSAIHNLIPSLLVAKGEVQYANSVYSWNSQNTCRLEVVLLAHRK